MKFKVGDKVYGQIRLHRKGMVGNFYKQYEGEIIADMQDGSYVVSGPDEGDEIGETLVELYDNDTMYRVLTKLEKALS